ncbi:aminotransferase class IV family protein [Amycolatopsis cihanbeyliensis]|uniref:Branched-subunit amino acid aminotransferase/4-amino-4-deoxychorismate lyase n=1 Tax=Amycolatopsis cihanbeyliensis TaxID=1128664 RepID=A0A542DDV2_AMYCI|nr:aminotransferase class IV family protein [Amycolatopsis cihanbeyliensis]TQJ01249.1 branched-subunit amino acid aminotransferase/4-amino-4-deoxychorismate lyase [Amycolatopsis cihanbeyliensis]
MTAPRRAEINGSTATAEQLALPALVNYGHFTSMQVRAGRVRGLAHHLRRLVDATRLLFGVELDTEPVRNQLRQAVAGMDAVSARVTVFSSRLTARNLAGQLEPDVLVTTGPPSEPPAEPLRVCAVEYQRFLPEIKHVGTFGLMYHRRAAQQAGFDDALFRTGAGHVSESTIWNVGFFDGDTVIWPQAPMLDGITQQLLREGLRRLGVPTETLALTLPEAKQLRSAFFANSSAPDALLASIDDTELAVDPELGELLRAAYEATPLEEI